MEGAERTTIGVFRETMRRFRILTIQRKIDTLDDDAAMNKVLDAAEAYWKVN